MPKKSNLLKEIDNFKEALFILKKGITPFSKAYGYKIYWELTNKSLSSFEKNFLNAGISLGIIEKVGSWYKINI